MSPKASRDQGSVGQGSGSMAQLPFRYRPGKSHLHAASTHKTLASCQGQQPSWVSGCFYEGLPETIYRGRKTHSEVSSIIHCVGQGGEAGLIDERKGKASGGPAFASLLPDPLRYEQAALTTMEQYAALPSLHDGLYPETMSPKKPFLKLLCQASGNINKQSN